MSGIQWPFPNGRTIPRITRIPDVGATEELAGENQMRVFLEISNAAGGTIGFDDQVQAGATGIPLPLTGSYRLKYSDVGRLVTYAMFGNTGIGGQEWVVLEVENWPATRGARIEMERRVRQDRRTSNAVRVDRLARRFRVLKSLRGRLADVP